MNQEKDQYRIERQAAVVIRPITSLVNNDRLFARPLAWPIVEEDPSGILIPANAYTSFLRQVLTYKVPIASAI